jgi:hypothetical protein
MQNVKIVNAFRKLCGSLLHFMSVRRNDVKLGEDCKVYCTSFPSGKLSFHDDEMIKNPRDESEAITLSRGTP